VQFIRHAANLALATLAASGAMPLDLGAAMLWCWREFGIVADWKDWLPGHADGSCFSLPQPDLCGRIWIARHATYPRFTLAHEIGHLLSENGAAFSLACDAYQTMPEERAANAFAAVLLIPDADFCECLADGWTLPQVAGHFGVPEHAIKARMQLSRLLGEVNVLLLDRALSGSDPS
jgi:hypothetical protein